MFYVHIIVTQLKLQLLPVTSASCPVTDKGTLDKDVRMKLFAGSCLAGEL